MHYVCITENQIISILNYEPNVPSDVELVTITDQEYDLLVKNTHKFDISLKKVVQHNEEYSASKEVEKSNIRYKELLSSTDWKVMRHIREKALGSPTTLSDEEYIALEQQRKVAADSIIKVA